SDSTQGHHSFAVLSWLYGVGGLDLAFGRDDFSKRLPNQLEHPGLVELAGYHQHRVIRLVVLFVERLQPFDRYVLEIRARPDGGLAVVVPEVGTGVDSGEQYRPWVILPPPLLVSNHRHLPFYSIL